MKTQKRKKPETWLCIGDIHFPQYDKKTLGAILSFLKQNKVDGLLLGGDSLDLETISHHTKGQPGLRRKGGLKSDLDGFATEVLSPLLKAIPKTAKKVWLDGNHERFLQDLFDEQPELEGMLSLHKHLKLKERGFTVIEQGGCYEIGELVVLHGDTIGSSGTIARKAVETFGQNVLMFHTHQLQAYTKTSPISKTRKMCGWTSPIVGSVSPRYLHKRNNSWINGMNLVLKRPNGTFNLLQLVITEGEFSYGGKTYSA